jgi:hypothetical protein
MSPALDPAITLALRGFGALLFAGAARHKLQDAAGFRIALAGYGLVPESALASIARGLAVLESVIAIGLLVPVLARASALAGSALLAGYALAMGAALARGRAGIDCGCGGAAGGAPVGPALCARNALGAALLALAALASGPRALGALDAANALGGALALLLIWNCVGQAIANAAALRTGRVAA